MDVRRDTLTKDERLLSNVVVFDLETTGLSPSDDEIIQIAAVRIERGVIRTTDRFISYVKPNRSIAAFITSLTGITNERVKTAPGALSALKKFSAFCGDALLIAHNGHAFDIQFIRSACCNSESNIREFRYFDSMHLSWLAWGRERYRSHSLDAVVSRLQINTEHSRGERVSRIVMEGLAVRGHETFSDWNYTISPRPNIIDAFQPVRRTEDEAKP